ncbi:MAG: hypothetical protein ABEK01_02025 [Candidatus Nanohaloarchaea archaeon]
MVQWKGEITREESGAKAARLDTIESFNVPNFFVLTREEVQNLLGGRTDPEEIMNAQFEEGPTEKIENAYGNIGMSSEVRNSSGRARNLVGGQRNRERVSVRISGEGFNKYRLNVGPSELEGAVKEVLASYYQSNEEPPALLFQKMIEPDHSGAALGSYLGGNGLMEVVEGLGVSLEKGINVPAMYLVRDGEVREVRVPREQVKITRHPVNGGHRREKTLNDSAPFSESEVEDFFSKLESEDLGVKFAYKRGTFYVVDAFETDSGNPFSSSGTSLKGIRVSEGRISGVAGRDVTVSDETMPPEDYNMALVAKKGGYTSTDAQKAREEGKPAVFSFRGDLEDGQRITLGPRDVETSGEDGGRAKEVSGPEKVPEKEITATEVLPLERGQRAVHTSPPFGEGYAVTGREVDAERIPPRGLLESYSGVFAFDGEKALLDARNLEKEGLEQAVDYLDAELAVLVLSGPDRDAVRSAVRNGFQAIASEKDLEVLERMVAEEEKRFLMDRLRELETG